MSDTKRRTIFFTFNLLAMLALAVFLVAPVLAHGGVDDEKPAPTPVSNHKGVVTQTARAGDFEIMLKHTALEPDTETAVKLFVTRFGTNEPFGDAKPTVEITTQDGKTFEASEIKADAPGSFSFKLPPLPHGTYTLQTRLSAAGKTETATFANMAVESPPSTTLADAASWARTGLMVLATIAVLGLLGGLMFYALRFAKGGQGGEEAVSA